MCIKYKAGVLTETNTSQRTYNVPSFNVPQGVIENVRLVYFLFNRLSNGPNGVINTTSTTQSSTQKRGRLGPLRSLRQHDGPCLY